MCGIFGMVGKSNVMACTVSGLKKLEYRGYDSSGIAFVQHGEMKCVKQVGEIAMLEKLLKNEKYNCLTAISHTRWATHGIPSVVNAHPHLSQDKNFALVHNGIIENYKELKEKYLKDVLIVSDTDTEIAVQLISKFYKGNVLEALKQTCDLIKGSYAFALINVDQPNIIYATKKDSPLVVSHSKKYGIVSSDVSPILDYTNKEYILSNYEYAIVSDTNIQFFDKNIKPITKNEITVKDDENEISLQGYPHFMIKEIYDIPKIIPNLLKAYPTPKSIYKCIPKTLLKQTKHFIFIGCGTAYHAGLVGKRAISELLNTDAAAEIASEFRYSNPWFKKHTLCVFISQSGETADTIAAVKQCRAMGVKTLSIVNALNSTITYESDYVMYLHAGKEIGVASTKAYIAQIVLLTLFVRAVAIAKDQNELKTYNECLNNISTLFETPNLIENFDKQAYSLSKQYKDVSSVYFIGRLGDYDSAMEAALKTKEITYILAEAYPSGELKHGTISLIVPNTLVVGFLCDIDVAPKTINTINEVKSRGASILLVSLNQTKMDGFINIVMPNTEPWCAALACIIPVQLLSYHISVLKGYNPDKPRNLAKSVTVE